MWNNRIWKSRKLWVIIVLILCIAGGGYLYAKNKDATAKPAYTTGKVERGTIASVISATGTINPVKYVDVSTNVAGKLESVLVKENQKVTEGEVIATIDDRQLQSGIG
nr:biotin/lipoyl-binding protein [uncultured Veillonella sp.]